MDVFPEFAGRVMSGRYVAKSGWPAWQGMVCCAVILGVGVVLAWLVIQLITNYFPTYVPRTLGMIGALGLMQLAVVPLAIIAARRGGKRARDVLALSSPLPSPGQVIAAFGGLIAIVAPYTLAVLILSPDSLARDMKPFQEMLATPWWWLVLLVVGVGAPLMEEILFRGFLQSALAGSRLGFGGGAFVSTVAWAGLHYGYSLAGLVEVTIVGFYFCWLLWRSGSLWLALACHAIYNSVLVAILLTAAAFA